MFCRDLFQFLLAFQEKLATSLANTGRAKFNNLNKMVTQIYSESDAELLELKNVFCYDYVDSLTRLD